MGGSAARLSATRVSSVTPANHKRSKMPSVQPRELPWSWERSPGWRGQFERMRRWSSRLRQASPDDEEALFDFTLAFFTSCYHLRDWLVHDVPSIQAALDQLFAASAPLRLSADIANIAKHLELTRPPRAERQLSFAREYVPGGTGWFGPDGRLVVLTGGEKIDVLDLVADCEAAWVQFLRTQTDH